MRIEVNGARIFFDVEGAKLVPDGKTMRENPTLLLLHGGPGFDHSDQALADRRELRERGDATERRLQRQVRSGDLMG